MAKKISKKLAEVINPFVTNKWAEWNASHLKPKHLVYRHDDKKGNRFYYFKYNEEWVIAAGITTILDKVSTHEDQRALVKWKEDNPNWRHLLNISSGYGTLEHMVHGDIMFGKGADKDKLNSMQELIINNGGTYFLPAMDVLAFMRFQEDYNLTPLLIEAQLVYEDPDSEEWIAMTIDLLAKMTVTIKTKTQEDDGVYMSGPRKGQQRLKDVTTEDRVDKILLIDFKGNFFEKDRKTFYESNKMQLMAAKLAVQQNFPDIKVDDVYNYAPNSWRTEPSYTFKKWDLTDDDWEVYDTYMKLAHLKGYNKPVGKMLITEGFKDSKDYKFLTYKEYVEQVLTKD